MVVVVQEVYSLILFKESTFHRVELWPEVAFLYKSGSIISPCHLAHASRASKSADIEVGFAR